MNYFMNEITHALKYMFNQVTKEPVCVMAKTFNGEGYRQL